MQSYILFGLWLLRQTSATPMAPRDSQEHGIATQA